MKTSTKTSAQHARETARHASGKFVKNPCELCGKGAPMHGYFSWSGVNTNGGMGLVLHERCVVKLEAMTVEDAVAALEARRAVAK